MAKFDNINTLRSTPKPRSKNKKTNGNTNSHIVGVRIDTKAKNTKKKIYYYKTDGSYTRGETIRIRVPSGGTPKATIAIENSSKKGRGTLKELRETK